MVLWRKHIGLKVAKEHVAIWKGRLQELGIGGFKIAAVTSTLVIFVIKEPIEAGGIPMYRRLKAEICKNTAIYVDHRDTKQIIEGVNTSIRGYNSMINEIRQKRNPSQFDYRHHLKTWDSLISSVSTGN